MIKSYYAIIPANVRYDNRLPSGAKLLYGEITALCNEKGFCWATNNYFCELYNVDKRTVIRWINELIEYGYLNKVLDNKGKYQRVLSIAGEGDKNVTPHDKNVTPLVTKMSPSNNTMNITDKKIKDKMIKDKMINLDNENHKITNYLISIGFISNYDLDLDNYNNLFNKYEDLLGTEGLNRSVKYITKNISLNDRDIIDNYSYLKTSINDYLVFTEKIKSIDLIE